MFGAIAGDIIGSVFEKQPIKTTDFPLFSKMSRFTDDTVLTIAAAHSILSGLDYASSFKKFGRAYPNAGYGGTFYQWFHSDRSEPYNSWGNGSAMRVSPVGFAFNSKKDVLGEAEKSAAVTHDHLEGIKGAQATALAIYMARMGEPKNTIRDEIEVRFKYNLNRTLDDIRPEYYFDVSCQGSVPESIIAFLESSTYEDAIRKAISLGGDSDKMACITGGIAHAYYKKIPMEIIKNTRNRLPNEFLEILNDFNAKFPLNSTC